MNTTERTFKSESQAHVARRVYIQRGIAVSLIAFDPSRDVYTFDVYGGLA